MLGEMPSCAWISRALQKHTPSQTSARFQVVAKVLTASGIDVSPTREKGSQPQASHHQSSRQDRMVLLKSQRHWESFAPSMCRTWAEWSGCS
jgi:uncharacterized ferritin-like protein (DUF455 family)